MANKKKNNLLQSFRKKRILSIIDKSNYKQRWSIQLSILNMITLLCLFFLVSALITYFALTYTSISPFTKGEESKNYRELAIKNRKKLDSIIEIKNTYQNYYERINTIILGETFKEDTLYKSTNIEQENADNVDLSPGRADSAFRNLMRSNKLNDKFNEHKKLKSIEGIFFYSPVDGQISRSYTPEKSHLGTDIAVGEETTISATQEGVVIYQGYSIQDGNIIILAHRKNLISIYKHNSEILKEIGDEVAAGEAIAISGNTGENSTGQHVHFEIWFNGRSVNPENYISFD